MRTCRRFAHFDPLTGEVPYWPYPELSDIVGRARRLLSGRSREEIHHLASVANDVIAEYFALAQHREVSRLLAQGQADFLEVDPQGWILGIKPERIDELDFRRPENTREADALEAGSVAWPDAFGEPASPPVLSRCLASLALAHVGDAVHRLHYQYDFEKRQYVHQEAKRLQPYDYIVATQATIAAIAAVDRAERLLDARGAITSAGEQEQAVTPPVSSRLGVATEQTLAERGDDARQRSERARQLATLRLANRNATRAAVLAEWDRDPQLQKMSHARAGVRLADWLASQDLERFEPRTIAQWISCCKKTTLQRR